MYKEWIAAYYPDDLVDSQQTKSLFCLLYDKVIVHFPIAGTYCGGGCGISEYFSDDPLVEEGVLEFREELLLNEIEQDFSSGFWGTKEEFRRYCDLNATGMALICCEKEGAVPATDKKDMPLPISLLHSLNISRSAHIQAGALALRSIQLTLPAFKTLTSYEVLEVREKLKDELIPFRAAMLALAPRVRAGITANASMQDLFDEAQYLVETNVIPRLTELKRRLTLEKGVFWRKVIQTTASCLPNIMLKMTSGSGMIAAIEAAKLAGGLAAKTVDNDKLVQDLLANGGLGYLLSIESELNTKVGIVGG